MLYAQLKLSLHPKQASFGTFHAGGPVKGLPLTNNSELEDLSERYVNSDPSLPDRFQVVSMLNLLSLPMEALTSIRTWPESWSPSGFWDLWMWRAISWPIFALPFWYCGGKGLDCLVAQHAGDQHQKKIHWYDLILATYGIAFAVIISLAFILGGTPEEHQHDPLHVAWIFAGIWIILLGSVWLSWVLQLHQRRRLKTTIV